MNSFCRIFFVIYISLSACVLFSQVESADGFDQEQFVSALKQTVISSNAFFEDIITDEQVETEYGKEDIVNVDFPGADLVTYSYEEFYDYMYYVVYDYVTVFYFRGNNAAQAEKLFNNIRNALQYCKQNAILGIWTLEEKSSTESDINYIDIVMRIDEFPDLYFTLYGKFSDTEQSIKLIFETEYFE